MNEAPVAEEAPKPLAAMVAQGLTITKIENETQQAFAVQKPRELTNVFQAAMAGLSFSPEYASRAFYTIPYKNAEGGTEKIEGPSIKAAMELARCWGNCANATRIVQELDDRIVVEGVFADHQTNMWTRREYSVSKMVWSRKLKAVIPLREDRLNMAIQAGMSKAVRNAILSSLPVYLVDQYFQTAKKISVEGMKKDAPTKQDRLAKAEKTFAKFGVTPERFKAYVDGTTFETEDDLLAHLIGIYNAISDGQKDADDVFPPLEAKPEAGPINEKTLFKA